MLSSFCIHLPRPNLSSFLMNYLTLTILNLLSVHALTLHTNWCSWSVVTWTENKTYKLNISHNKIKIIGRERWIQKLDSINYWHQQKTFSLNSAIPETMYMNDIRRFSNIALFRTGTKLWWLWKRVKWKDKSRNSNSWEEIQVKQDKSLL